MGAKRRILTIFSRNYAIGTERCSLRPYHRLKDGVLARSCPQPAVGIQACRPEAPKRGDFQKNTRPTQNERPGDSNALPRVDSYATNRRAKGSRRARSDVPSVSPAVTIGVILLVADLRTAGWDRGRERSGERRRGEEKGGKMEEGKTSGRRSSVNDLEKAHAVHRREDVVEGK